MKIIKYEPKYEADVEQVFLWAGSKRTRTTDGLRELMHAAFCDYYIKKETESCFITINEDDKAIGYVLCAKTYDQQRIDEYVLEKNMEGLDELMHMSMSMYPKFQQDYPSHLHINILPDYQRDGIGTMLMKTLFDYLKEEKVNGVMLGVAAHNEKGISFYKKCGFNNLEGNEQVNIMGIKIGE